MKIGIIRTSSIGDVVLATVCLDYLRRVAPQAEVVWVGRHPSLGVLQASWPQLKTIELSSKASSVVMQGITDELVQCHAVVDLQTSLRSRRLLRRVRKAGVPVFSADKHGFFRAWLVISSWLRGRIFKVLPASRHPQKLQYVMMLEAVHAAATFLGIQDPVALANARPALLDLKYLATDASWVREMEFGHWLGVAPGASFPSKRAPTEVFRDTLIELLRLWPKDLAIPGLVFVGGPEDRSAAIELMDETHWSGPVINLAGKLSLEDTTRALGRTSVLLSNDSGLAHIAEAVGKPVAVLFGPTVETFGFSPRGKDSVAYSSDLGCRPCSKHGKQSCRYGDHLCFRMIDTRAIAKHLKTQLTAGGAT